MHAFAGTRTCLLTALDWICCKIRTIFHGRWRWIIYSNWIICVSQQTLAVLVARSNPLFYGERHTTSFGPVTTCIYAGLKICMQSVGRPVYSVWLIAVSDRNGPDLTKLDESRKCLTYHYDIRGKPSGPRSGRPKHWESFQWTTKPRLLGAIHVLYTISRLFLSCRSWSTVSRLMLTASILDSAWPVRTVWPVCRCVVYTDCAQKMSFAFVTA